MRWIFLEEPRASSHPRVQGHAFLKPRDPPIVDAVAQRWPEQTRRRKRKKDHLTVGLVLLGCGRVSCLNGCSVVFFFGGVCLSLLSFLVLFVISGK